jgi:hypothetical protein
MKHKFTAVLLICTVFTFACTVDQVLADINLCLQTAASLETALGVISPADSAALQVITGLATAGLNVIQKDYDTWKASGSTSDLQKLVAACQSLQTNLPQNLAAAHISDPTVVQKTTAWVNLVTTTVGAMAAAWPQVNAASTKSRMAKAAASLPSPSALHDQWLKNVCLGDTSCGNLVKVGG